MKRPVIQAKHPRLWGYARVSTDDQNLNTQRAKMIEFGVKPEHIIEEKASGKNMDRKMLQLMQHELILRSGDTLVVWKLDRLGRDLMGVLGMIQELDERGVKLVSITEGFDVRTPMGKAMLQIAMVFAELERNMISERTKAGMAQRKAEGVIMGPKPKITGNKRRMAKLRKMDKAGKLRDKDGFLIPSRGALLDILNDADPKARPIGSTMTIRRWEKDGYPGLEED